MKRIVFLFLIGWTTLAFAQSEEVELRFARRLYEDGMYALAAEQLARFVQSHPSSGQAPEAQMLLAHAYAKAGQHEKAVNAYQSFIMTYPDDIRVPECWFKAAESLQTLGRYLEASTMYLKLHRLFPVGDFAAESLFQAGISFTMADEPQKAIKTFQQLISTHPKSRLILQAQYHIAQSLLHTGDQAGALEAFEALLKTKQDFAEKPEALLTVGQVYLDQGKIEQAEKVLGQLRRSYPKSEAAVRAQYLLADRYFESKAFDRAAEALSALLQVSTADTLVPDLLLKLAEAYRQTERYSLAIETYQKLLAGRLQEADRVQALWGLGQCYIAQKDYTNALAAFQDLIDLRPYGTPGIEALVRLGDIHVAEGRPLRAIESYERYLAVASDPPKADAIRYQIAQLYETSLGWLEEAIGVYRRLAAGTSPYAALAGFAWARCLEREGDVHKAAAQYRSFLGRYPEHALSKQATERAEYLEDFVAQDPEATLQRMLETFADHLGGKSDAGSIYDLARISYDYARDFERALDLFRTYLVMQPAGEGSDDARYWTAVCYQKLARKKALESDSTASYALLEQAEQAYQQFLEAHPKSEWADDATLFLIERQAARSDTADRFRVASYRAFRERYPISDQDDLVLLRLGDTYRRLMTEDPTAAVQALRFYGMIEQAHPTSEWMDDAWFGIGNVHLLLGQYDAAQAAFERIVHSYPQSPLRDKSLWSLGDLAYSRAQYDQAIAVLSELLAQRRLGEDRQAMARFRLAEAHFHLKQWDKAIARYEQLLHEKAVLKDHHQVVRYHLARAYQALGDPQAALIQYDAFLQHYPNAAQADSALFTKANLLLQMDQREEAMESFQQLTERFPSSVWALSSYKVLMKLYIQMEKHKDVLAVYRKIASQLDMQDVELAGGAAIALFKVGQIDNALKAAKLFEKKYEHQESWLARFKYEEGLYYKGNKDYPKAQKSFKKVAEDFKGTVWADDAAYHNAHILYISKDSKAAEAFEQFLQGYPDSPYTPDVSMRLGAIYYDKTQYVEAIDAYRRVIHNPNPGVLVPDAMFNAILIYEKLSRYADALKLAQEFVERFPDNESSSRMQVKIGVFLMELGKFQAAIDQLKACYSQVSAEDEAEIRFYLAECYFNLGDYKNAILEYLKVAYLHRDQVMWAVTAEYKAGISYEQLGRSDAAKDLYKRLIVHYGAESEWSKAAQKRLDALELQE